MTTLVVEKLFISLEQEFNFTNDSRYHVAAFYPYLYLHDSPVGTFTISLIKDASVIFQKSFTSSDIKTALNTSNNYAHVFYPIIPDNPIQLSRGVYSLKLTSSGYSAGDSFIGWIRQHEDLNNILDYIPLSDEQNPLATRLKVYKNGIDNEV